MKFEKRTDGLLRERDNLKASGNGAQPSERLEDTGDDEPAIPHLAGLDVSDALRRLDGDSMLYHRMLRTFFAHQSNAVSDIEEALSAGDTKLALHHANTVKCIAGTMGAVELERLALAFRTAIVLDELPAGVRAILDNFGTEIDRLVRDLASHLQTTSQTGDDPLADTAE